MNSLSPKTGTDLGNPEVEAGILFKGASHSVCSRMFTGISVRRILRWNSSSTSAVGKAEVSTTGYAEVFRTRPSASSWMLTSPKQLRGGSKLSNVSILTDDAVEVLPRDGSFIYLYNPFDEGPMRRFAERMATQEAGASIRVLYNVPKHADVFRNDARWCVKDLPVRFRGAGPSHRASFYEFAFLRWRTIRDQAPRNSPCA